MKCTDSIMNSKTILSSHSYSYSYIKADQTPILSSSHSSISNNWFTNLKLQYLAQCTVHTPSCWSKSWWKREANCVKTQKRSDKHIILYSTQCLFLWRYPFKVIIPICCQLLRTHWWCCLSTLSRVYTVCKFLGPKWTLINNFNRHRPYSRSKVIIYTAPCESLHMCLLTATVLTHYLPFNLNLSIQTDLHSHVQWTVGLTL